MICPYNGFVEMDCEKCAAWNKVIDPGSDTYTDTITACTIAYNGGAVPARPLLMMPEVKQCDEWR